MRSSCRLFQPTFIVQSRNQVRKPLKCSLVKHSFHFVPGHIYIEKGEGDAPTQNFYRKSQPCERENYDEWDNAQETRPTRQEQQLRSFESHHYKTFGGDSSNDEPLKDKRFSHAAALPEEA